MSEDHPITVAKPSKPYPEVPLFRAPPANYWKLFAALNDMRIKRRSFPATLAFF
jgi:hypothetical protein